MCFVVLGSVLLCYVRHYELGFVEFSYVSLCSVQLS
nr:MAG TPA: hypothetical protein [Caudoviricetes sp.]